MIRSMTGFASVGREELAGRVTVTLKSVNHRFLDVAVKAPHSLASLESRVKTQLSQRLTRGRVEVSISVEWTAPPEREVTLDEALLDRIARVIDAARAKGLVTGSLTASDVLRIPQAIDIRTRTETTAGVPPDGVAELVERVLGEAIESLIAMRETEGRFLETDLSTKLDAFMGMVEAVERYAADGQRALEARLRDRLAELPADLQGDGAAVAQEIVRYIARSDIDEELVRLRGHISHWRSLVSGGEPCGRKLDFLVQELNREINTVGSKTDGPHVPELVIGAKAELERIREQVQNVE